MTEHGWEYKDSNKVLDAPREFRIGTFETRRNVCSMVAKGRKAGVTSDIVKQTLVTNVVQSYCLRNCCRSQGRNGINIA
jgi:hypothetical protein